MIPLYPTFYLPKGDWNLTGMTQRKLVLHELSRPPLSKRRRRKPWHRRLVTEIGYNPLSQNFILIVRQNNNRNKYIILVILIVTSNKRNISNTGNSANNHHKDSNSICNSKTPNPHHAYSHQYHFRIGGILTIAGGGAGGAGGGIF